MRTFCLVIGAGRPTDNARATRYSAAARQLKRGGIHAGTARREACPRSGAECGAVDRCRRTSEWFSRRLGGSMSDEQHVDAGRVAAPHVRMCASYASGLGCVQRERVVWDVRGSPGRVLSPRGRHARHPREHGIERNA